MSASDTPLPTPAALHHQASAEHPDDPGAARARYHELMVEHGHLIPGDPQPLPCGWPNDTRSTDA